MACGWPRWPGSRTARSAARGATVLTPGYPGAGQGEVGLRALCHDPDVVASVGVRGVMGHLTQVISELDGPSVVMGHSFGGTFAPLLAGNGLGSAGVSISGAGVKGIKALPFSELRCTSPLRTRPRHATRERGNENDDKRQLPGG